MVSETFPRGANSEGAGGFIIVCASLLSAVLVLAGLIYAAGTPARRSAELAAAGCEPSLSPPGIPCTTQQMTASRYTAMTATANRQLAADITVYNASQSRNLRVAESALSGEVTTEQTLDRGLASALYTPQNKATAINLNTVAFINGNNMPMAAILFPPQVSTIATALIKANQALATLTARQAKATSLRQMRSLNRQHAADQAAVEVQARRIRRALGLTSQGHR